MREGFGVGVGDTTVWHGRCEPVVSGTKIGVVDTPQYRELLSKDTYHSRRERVLRVPVRRTSYSEFLVNL